MNQKAHDIAIEVLNCAMSWEPQACLLGNVRADEIVFLCKRLFELENENEKLDHQLHYDFVLDN